MKLHTVVLLLSFCCAALASHSARVVFNSRGIRGYITFTEQEDGNIRIVANLTGLRGGTALPELHLWHIHNFPVDQSLDPADQCAINQLGGFYDPFGALANPNYSADCFQNQNQSLCAAGDLASKFMPLPMDGQLDIVDMTGQLSLSGRYSIVGRSLVIHVPDATFAPLECGTIRLVEEVEGAQVRLMQATFISPIAGTIYMRQVEGQDVEIFGKLYWVDDTASTSGHNWHIHTNQTEERYLEGYQAGCANVGPPYDPTQIGPNFVENYTALCTPATPGRCRIGDMVGKHGSLSVTARPDPYQNSAFFFTDSYLNLTDVVNRTVVVHLPDGGGPGIACAPLVMSENFTLNAAGAEARFITASQTGPFEDTLINAYGIFGNDVRSLPTSDLTILGSAFGPTSTDCPREGVYSPYDNYTGEGLNNTPDRYDLGDWNSRYGNYLTPFNSFNVFDMPIYGANSMAGRTMRSVLNSTSRVCSSWTPVLAPQLGVLSARAVFSGTNFGPIEGVMYFFQTDYGNFNYGQTLVVLDIYYTGPGLNTSGHNWHVHQTPPVDGMSCVDSIGGHYNPFSVSLGTLTNQNSNYSDYASDCSPTYPLRCESGDLSGKHGKLTITSDGVNSYPTYAYLDPNLQLTGMYSIVGRSIGIHNFTGPLFDCAPVSRFVLSTNTLAVNVTAGQYSRNEFNRLITDGTDVSPTDVFIAGGQFVYPLEEEPEVECILFRLRILGDTSTEADANYDLVSTNVENMGIRCQATADAKALAVSFMLLGLSLLVALFSN